MTIPRPLSLPEHSLASVDVIHHSDALSLLRGMGDKSVNCVVTSPPYFGLRDYGVNGQIGLESTPAEFIGKLIAIFREVRRVLTDDGTVWVNLGDSYASGEIGRNDSVQGRRVDGRPVTKKFDKRQQARQNTALPPKSLMMIPARFAIAMQDDGWILRSEIVWAKKNPLPESVTDRPSKAHEMVYMFTKNPHYYYDQNAVRQTFADDTMARLMRGVSDNHKNTHGVPGQTVHTLAKPRKHAGTSHGSNGSKLKGHSGVLDAEGQLLVNPQGANLKDVWHLSTQPYRGAHFAVMPQELVKRCILAGCPPGGVVLDMFMGSGTVALVAKKFGRRYIGCDLNREYVLMARQRLGKILLPIPDKVLADGTTQLSLFGDTP